MIDKEVEMKRIVFLGTGNGMTLDLYNTCFSIQNNNENFLIDTGGSVEIIRRLENLNIELKDIKHIFVSHNHTDHILGLIWIFKKIGVDAIAGRIQEKINIYCNDVVYESISEISKLILPKKIFEGVFNIIEFHVLEDGENIQINGIEYEFFDINARGTKQFGFECFINDKKVIFLGDETVNSNLYKRVENADFVMHEAFCLDSEENIFHAYEKNHSTVKTASEIMNKLNVKNLILYHTEETHGKDRKRLYLEEAEKHFKGNTYVPNDLDIIEL